MRDNNICKFNLNFSNDLICSKFIYETANSQCFTEKTEINILNLVSKGEGIVNRDGVIRELKVGSLFFIRKGEYFSVSGENVFEYLYISFSGRRADEYMSRFNVTKENFVFNGYEYLIDFWMDSIRCAYKMNIDLLSEATLLYTLAKLKPELSKTNNTVLKIETLTNELFADPALSLNTISEKLGYNTSYISSMFKKNKGISYTEYLQGIRIKHAMFLIEQGLISVTNVALLSGYNDPLYFSKVFKSINGMSPKEYMKLLLH